MATFAQAPYLGCPDSWLNMDSITHVKPNGDETDIFMFGGYRITTPASPDTIMRERNTADGKFIKLLMVTRWTGELESEHGWLNIHAVAYLQDGGSFTDIHLQDGSFLSTPNKAADLVRWFERVNNS